MVPLPINATWIQLPGPGRVVRGGGKASGITVRFVPASLSSAFSAEYIRLTVPSP